jgi:hypothetical protein
LRYLDASIVNSRFSRQWFCDRKAMKEDNVYGGGALLARISARFGFRLCGLGMFFGMETVKGAFWQSERAILMSSPSKSSRDEAGEEMVELVRMDRGLGSGLRDIITLLRNCL